MPLPREPRTVPPPSDHASQSPPPRTCVPAGTARGVADQLCAYIDASPSPFHAVAEAARLLSEAGFVRMRATHHWPRDTKEVGRFLVRGGALMAWGSRSGCDPATPFRVVGAHSDSPNLRIKPSPCISRAGWDLLGVEVYGEPLLNSWLDRDLGLSGRVAVRAGDDPSGVDYRLIRVDEPALRVAQLAVHLDRGVNDEGLRLNRQTHLTALWGTGTTAADAPDFRAYLGDLTGHCPADVLGWDVMTHDLTPARRLGRVGDLVAAPRLDNLCSAFAGIRAVIDAVARPDGGQASVPVVVLFDHEEIGSVTERGGFSQLLPSVLERIVLGRGGGREDLLRALAGTMVASADMAHGVHPNYPERSEPDHPVHVNGGPVVKINARGRYATDAAGLAVFQLACEQAGVPMQHYLARGDMPCGSTIGPITAALTGAVTVDVGAPMLSMHSARELCGADDPAAYLAALTAFLTPV
ncbi:MAG TPA: M18 family aminopeptidase [Dermatophilaceae bacterium]|nr:M18 family aminopeptidase [Dermatophilaceae bacterium]